MADTGVEEQQVGEQNGAQIPDYSEENHHQIGTAVQKPARPGDSIFASKSEDDPAKIFVGGLNSCTTHETLQDYFSTYGKVIDVNVKYSQDRLGNLRDTAEQMRSRGFGFVLFESADVAKKVLSEEHTVDGKLIEVKKAVRQGQPRSKKLFVGGISNSISEDILDAYFSAFGKISETKIFVNHVTQRRRGFAFIQFEDESTVDTIAEVKYHDLTDGSEKCRVEVKPVSPQNDKFGRGGYRGRGGFRGDSRGRGFGRGGSGYGGHQGGGYQGNNYNQWGGYNQGGQDGYNNQGGYDQGGYYQGGYNQGGYDQSGYNQGYDQQYQGYNYNYGQNYGNQDGSMGQYAANGSGYQTGYQTGYDGSTCNYGGAEQYNYGTNYGQETSNYGKAPAGGYQHNTNQPY